MNLESNNEPTKAWKMTRFICQELMYEYVSGALDPQREKDIQNFLPTDVHSQRELERIHRALEFTDKASRSKVSPQLHEALLKFEPQWQKQLRELTLWSSRRGWRLLPYVFVLLTLAVGLAVWKPWQEGSPDLTLAQIENVEVKVPSDMPATPPPQVAPAQVLSAPPTESPALVGAAPVPVVTMEESPPNLSPPVAKGEVRRAELTVNEISETWPGIRDKIIALGGKKYGSAQFGGLRKVGQTSFHFTLPQSNLSELQSFLGGFGPVRFEVEKVPKVMPQGQIRIILNVKDAAANESSPETP